MDEENGQPIVEAWREQFGDAGGVSLRGELAHFPELEHAIALPELQTDVLEGSYLSWNGEGIEGPVHVIWRTSDGTRVGMLSLDFFTAEGEISLEDMHLPRGYQAQGLGRAVVAELAALGDALGIEALITMAADVGRYAWARCGFDFMEDDTRHLVVRSAAEFAGALGRPFDGSSIAHSWELAEYAGEDVPLAQVAQLRGEEPPPEDAPAIKFGQALLLGPRNNDWPGRLELAAGSPSRTQLAREE